MAAVTAGSSPAELAMDQFPNPVLVLDSRRRVITANRAAYACLQLEPGEITGKDLTEVIKTDDPTWCSTDPVDRLGSPGIGQKLDARVGGASRLLRVGVYPVRDGEEETGMLVTIREAEEGESYPQEEKDRLTSLGELSACVAHEIRNPLTGIRTTVQFVDSKLDPEDPRREDLREVITEIDRIEQIIENLLLFARPVEGNRVEADLNAVLVRVLDSMEAQLKEAEVEVKRNLSPELPLLVFSPDNMQQVLHNLVRNALEAMPEGGKLKVTTTLRRFRSERAPAAEIIISDTGHGIPDDLMKNIFKPFFTTRHNGTGLGLPIVASIVRTHAGQIYARNRAQGGTTFRISLPLEQEAKADQ
jgi:nitrogen-specific signal transduction histidine kinase